MNNTRLFVGGPLDGQRIDTGDAMYWHAAIVPEMPIVFSAGTPSSGRGFEKCTYQIRRIRSELISEPDMLIYCDPMWSNDKLLRVLADGYRAAVKGERT